MDEAHLQITRVRPEETGDCVWRRGAHDAVSVVFASSAGNRASSMAAQFDGATAAAVTGGQTCGICLDDPRDPLELPCGHSFCDDCLDGWRSRYGVDEEMRRKCPTCRARIPPSKEMVESLLACRARKQELEDSHDTSSEHYHDTCISLAIYEERVGVDWDGVTVLRDKNDEPVVELPEYIFKAIGRGDIKSVLRWIDADRSEDRVNAVTGSESYGTPVLSVAARFNHLALTTLLLQLGADIDCRADNGFTTISLMFCLSEDVSERVRLLLSWGASFFQKSSSSKELCIDTASEHGNHDLANLLKSELGGRRCEIVNLSSQPDLNGKTCVADEYLPTSNQYKVTLDTKSKEVLLLSPDNLKRRDRTPQDCGYYIEFKNGRTIRHDFDSSEDCQAFVAALNDKGETQPAVTEEAETRAEQAAAKLLAELGLDDLPGSVPASDGKVKKSKKKKGGKKKKK